MRHLGYDYKIVQNLWDGKTSKFELSFMLVIQVKFLPLITPSHKCWKNYKFLNYKSFLKKSTTKIYLYAFLRDKKNFKIIYSQPVYETLQLWGRQNLHGGTSTSTGRGGGPATGGKNQNNNLKFEQNNRSHNTSPTMLSRQNNLKK